ncbi:hypothetical protein MRX96_048267 [Rhipicephalus microplus]
MTLPPSNHVDRQSALRGEAEQKFSLRESGVHLHRGAMSSPAITVKAAEDCPKVASAQTPNSGHAKPKMPKADECRIVITDCDGAEDATDRDSRVAAWLGQDASAASSAIEEGELSRCDSQPRRHHKHRHKRRQRKHHHHRHSSTHSRSSRSDEPTATEMIVVTVSAVILTIALLLIGITLALTPKIDEMGRIVHAMPKHDDTWSSMAVTFMAGGRRSRFVTAIVISASS